MSFKNFIKKLWKNREPKIEALYNLNDNIPIPSREVLNKDQEKLEFLDSIKNNYSEILQKQKNITSIDLSSDNLYHQMTMYIELLLNLLETEKINKSFEKAFYYNNGTEKMNIMIKMSKLKLYYYRIEQLAIEANVRRMALKEILEEKKFLFSRRKKNSIIEELNHLTVSLWIYVNQITTIKLKIDTCLTKYEELENEEFIEKSIENELLKNRYIELQNTLMELDSNINIPSKSDRQELDIAILEELISKYIYEHKEEATKIKEEITLLESDIKEALNPELLLSKVETLEKKLKTFTLYGHNLISEAELLKFYNLKFFVITYNIIEKEEQHLAEQCSFLELECYEKVIMKKIAQLSQGEVPFLQEKFSKKLSVVIRAIKEKLKNEQKEFNFYDILNDKKKLGLLLAIETPNGLENYFKKCMELKSQYDSDIFHENILEFKDVLSLDTIYSMIYYDEDAICLEPLYKIFQILKKEEQENSKGFRFPEGLVSIKDKPWEVKKTDRFFIEKVKKLSFGKILEFPSSLLYIGREWFDRTFYQDIIFQNGLKAIVNNFQNVQALSVTFPSSIKTIIPNTFSNSNIQDIYIKQYKELQLDKNSLYYLFNTFFQIRRNESKQALENLVQVSASWINGAYIPDEPIEYEITPKFQSITFLDDDTSITIYKEQLRKQVFEYETAVGVDKIDQFKVEELMKDIKQIIEEQEMRKRL